MIAGFKRKILFLFLVAAASCIDPYIPDLKDYNSLLVVEGLLTNENSSHKIKLSRTTGEESSVPEMVTDADVYITDGGGLRTDLENCYDGYYKTDSTMFTGTIGQVYTLHILTREGKEYKSDECSLIPVAGIDKLEYEKGEEISGTQGEMFAGLKILLSSADATGKNQYCRWTFEEIWKTVIPFTQQYSYAFLGDTTFYFKRLPFVENLCWKKYLSTEVMAGQMGSSVSNSTDRQEIQFIAPDKTDRLTSQYSILVKQYSLSKKEYEFWNNLKKVGEAGGDIFAAQPYTVISNIHNINNPDEMVLGYFEVSAVTQKRIFIYRHDLVPLNLPEYKTGCYQFSKCPDDWPPPLNPWSGPFQPTFAGIYQMYTANGEYTWLRPEVSEGTIIAGTVYTRNLVKFVFAPKACTVCGSSGINSKPDFWIDPE
jgi:hypothetical protein